MGAGLGLVHELRVRAFMGRAGSAWPIDNPTHGRKLLVLPTRRRSATLQSAKFYHWKFLKLSKAKTIRTDKFIYTLMSNYVYRIKLQDITVFTNGYWSKLEYKMFG